MAENGIDYVRANHTSLSALIRKLQEIEKGLHQQGIQDIPVVAFDRNVDQIADVEPLLTRIGDFGDIPERMVRVELEPESNSTRWNATKRWEQVVYLRDAG